MESPELQYGQANFNLPHDVVQFPSKGVFYKNKKKAAKVGYLTAADENMLMGSSGNDIIINLLRSKLYEPDLKPEDLLNGDIEAILIFLRNTSFGPEYVVTVTDPKTGKKFDTTLILDALEVLKTDVLPDDEGLFSATLPKSDAKVKLRPLTYRDRNEIDKNAELYPAGRIAPVVTWRLQKQIVEVNGEREMGKINDFITSLLIMDSKFIRTFMSKNEPKLNLSREVICPSGDKITVQINFGSEFFRPFF